MCRLSDLFYGGGVKYKICRDGDTVHLHVPIWGRLVGAISCNCYLDDFEQDFGLSCLAQRHRNCRRGAMHHTPNTGHLYGRRRNIVEGRCSLEKHCIDQSRHLRRYKKDSVAKLATLGKYTQNMVNSFIHQAQFRRGGRSSLIHVDNRFDRANPVQTSAYRLSCKTPSLALHRTCNRCGTLVWTPRPMWLPGGAGSDRWCGKRYRPATARLHLRKL